MKKFSVLALLMFLLSIANMSCGSKSSGTHNNDTSSSKEKTEISSTDLSQVLDDLKLEKTKETIYINLPINNQTNTQLYVVNEIGSNYSRNKSWTNMELLKDTNSVISVYSIPKEENTPIKLLGGLILHPQLNNKQVDTESTAVYLVLNFSDIDWEYAGISIHELIDKIKQHKEFNKLKDLVEFSIRNDVSLLDNSSVMETASAISMDIYTGYMNESQNIVALHKSNKVPLTDSGDISIEVLNANYKEIQVEIKSTYTVPVRVGLIGFENEMFDEKTYVISPAKPDLKKPKDIVGVIRVKPSVKKITLRRTEERLLMCAVPASFHNPWKRNTNYPFESMLFSLKDISNNEALLYSALSLNPITSKIADKILLDEYSLNYVNEKAWTTTKEFVDKTMNLIKPALDSLYTKVGYIIYSYCINNSIDCVSKMPEVFNMVQQINSYYGQGSVNTETYRRLYEITPLDLLPSNVFFEVKNEFTTAGKDLTKRRIDFLNKEIEQLEKELKDEKLRYDKNAKWKKYVDVYKPNELNLEICNKKDGFVDSKCVKQVVPTVIKATIQKLKNDKKIAEEDLKIIDKSWKGLIDGVTSQLKAFLKNAFNKATTFAKIGSMAVDAITSGDMYHCYELPSGDKIEGPVVQIMPGIRILNIQGRSYYVKYTIQKGTFYREKTLCDFRRVPLPEPIGSPGDGGEVSIPPYISELTFKILFLHSKISKFEVQYDIEGNKVKIRGNFDILAQQSPVRIVREINIPLKDLVEANEEYLTIRPLLIYKDSSSFAYTPVYELIYFNPLCL